jgi:hypothetical protein
MGLSMTSEPSMTTRVGHGAAQSPTTATQFSPPCATSCMNQGHGNHPGTLVQDGDSVRMNAAPNANVVIKNHPGTLAQNANSGRLNAAPNGAITNNNYRCIGDESRLANIGNIDHMETIDDIKNVDDIGITNA